LSRRAGRANGEENEWRIENGKLKMEGEDSSDRRLVFRLSFSIFHFPFSIPLRFASPLAAHSSLSL
jgi:hypothetical protein